VAERNRQIEDCFFRVAAALEGFLTDWFIRCLSFETTQFEATFRRRAENQAFQDLRRWDPAHRLWGRKARSPIVHVSIPIDLRVSQTEAAAYLGWGEGTRFFKGARELEELASDFLVARFSSRIASLSDAQKRVIDATIAVRNVLAHRSPRAVTAMNQALTAGALPAPLRRTGNRVSARGVGAYLRADAGGRPRCRIYIEDLAGIARALAPGGPAVVICP
jgi:hypothetical protein